MGSSCSGNLVGLAVIRNMNKVDRIKGSLLRPLVARDYSFLFVFLRPPAQDAQNVSQRKMTAALDLHDARDEKGYHGLTKLYA